MTNPTKPIALCQAALAAFGIATSVSAQPEPPAPLRMYTQRVEVRFASAEQAAQASIQFAPVFDDRQWALSARWDDNHAGSLTMREVMARNGLKGTFYLNQTDAKGQFGADYARRLMQDGCSVGGHTQTHPKLAEVTPGAAFYEILANRVEREAQTDCPMATFAFPYGQFKSDDHPRLWETTTRALHRAGFSHCLYLDFVRENPYLLKDEFSSVLQVVPGDREVNAQQFRERLGKILELKDAFSEHSRCISLGVHPWQTGDEWRKLEELFREDLAGRDNWWYCNQDEYAAYHRQVHRSRLEALPPEADAAVRCYTLHRPHPADLGAMTPLTCVVEGGQVEAVTVDQARVEVRSTEGRAIVNVPHAAGKTLPTRIGSIHMAGPSDTPAEPAACEDFPRVHMLLGIDEAGKMSLQCRPEVELREVWVRFRLPVQYVEGVLTEAVETLAAGETRTVTLPMPAKRDDPFWAEGPQLYVAEVDFTAADGPGRLFVTLLR